MPNVYIIVVTWNSEKYLSDLFLSLHDLGYPRNKWNLIVVDNGSKDGTINILNSWLPKMHNLSTIIYNSENKGFASANNQAIRYALKQDADYIVLLNDDTRFESDWLATVIKTMQQNKNIGLAQPLITRYPDIGKVNSYGNAYHFLGFGYSYAEGKKIKELNLADYQPAYLSFTAVVIKAEVFKQIGLLDENYFSYHEDSDLCFRARLAKWDILVIKDAIVHHKYKFPALKSKQRYFWLEKNRYYLILKFFQAKTLLLITPACIIMELGLLAYSLLNGFFRQRLQAYWWILKNFSKILSARRQIQQSRKFNDKHLYSFMSGKIEFQHISNVVLKYLGNPVLNLYFKFIKKII